MAFHLRQEESPARGLRRLARKELRSAARVLRQRRRSNLGEAIHEARRHIKKARTVLSVIEEDRGAGFRKDHKRLKRVSRTLGLVRDADVTLEVFDQLRRRSKQSISHATFALVRRQLEQDRQQLRKDTKLDPKLKRTIQCLRRMTQAAKAWKPRHKSFAALAAALTASRREGRKTMARARDRQRAADFHEWRKAVKRLWYELRLIAECGPSVRADIRALKQLETWLGDDHNCVVLCGRLFSNPLIARSCGDLSKLQHIADRYQDSLRRQALAHGKEIYRTDPKPYVKQIKRLWRGWRQSSGRMS
jgi:CHAD domain-containing protein